MKSLLNYILIIIVAVFFSCTQAQKIERIVNDIEQQQNKITDEQWAEYDQAISDLKTNMDKNRSNYNEEDREKLNKLIGKYYALKAQKKLMNFKNDLHDAGQQLEGMIDSFLEMDSTKNTNN